MRDGIEISCDTWISNFVNAVLRRKRVSCEKADWMVTSSVAKTIGWKRWEWVSW